MADHWPSLAKVLAPKPSARKEEKKKTKADLQGSSEATNVRQWDWSSATQEDDVGSVAKRWPLC